MSSNRPRRPESGNQSGRQYSHRSGRQSGHGRSDRRQKPADAARLVAAKALVAVDVDDQFANLVLPKMLREEQTANPRFTRQDAAFASELVYGTTRRQGTLDWILQPHSTKPLDDLDASVRACLRMGAYQIMYTRVADHASVGETVTVARELAGEGPSRFVNAVLRSVLREGPDAMRERMETIPDEGKRLGIEHSHPQWIVEAVGEALEARNFYGEHLERALEANNVAADVTLAARPSEISTKDLAEEAEDILGRATRQGTLSPYAVVLEGGVPGALPSIRDGSAGVQDEGSQLAAFLLANAPLEGQAQESDTQWLDLCAGPGGKAALLASIGKDRGVELTANEVSPRRAKLLERSVQALDNVQVTVADGRKYRGKDRFSRVLVDAPCLGLGSLRRRPESRWRHLPSDLEELVPLQQQLLRAAVDVTQSGGVIAWVTCSPHVRETLEQVATALMLEPVELIDAAALAQELIPGGIDLGEPGPDSDVVGTLDYIAARTVQLWPHIHGTDAMFIALLRKMPARTPDDH